MAATASTYWAKCSLLCPVLTLALDWRLHSYICLLHLFWSDVLS
jgi:hypothetical protein